MWHLSSQLVGKGIRMPVDSIGPLAVAIRRICGGAQYLCFTIGTVPYIMRSVFFGSWEETCVHRVSDLPLSGAWQTCLLTTGIVMSAYSIYVTIKSRMREQPPDSTPVVGLDNKLGESEG